MRWEQNESKEMIHQEENKELMLRNIHSNDVLIPFEIEQEKNRTLT